MRFKVNFYIHIYDHPMYIIKNFDSPFKNIHLSYHDGEHYNSIRLKEDFEEDIPQDIPLSLMNCVEQSSSFLPSQDYQEDESVNEEENEKTEIQNNGKLNTNKEPIPDEIIVDGILIKELKEKTQKFKKSFMTQERLVLEERGDNKSCHCKYSGKKYKNCCLNKDVKGEHDKDKNIFYCDLEEFKQKIHYEIKDKNKISSSNSNTDLSVNNVTKQMERIFI